MPKPLIRRKNSETRGRHLVASESIRKGQLIFVERPMIVMQSTGNAMQGALTCHYCMAFVGTPQQSLQISSDPLCLPAITTTMTTRKNEHHCEEDENNDHDDPYALIPCRHQCGHVYCSLECQQDDWEYGGHKELCTGWIDDINHPLVKFKQHAVETNEIFLIVGQWLARILKQNLPYNDDDHLNDHPYTDFQMNPWWDVNTVPIKNKPGRLEEAIEIEQACKRLCEDSCEYLRQAWPQYKDNKWLTPLGLARLIGSLEQNCVGVRRKHAIRQNIMDDIELRHTCHSHIIRCLENAGLIGSDDVDDDDDDNNDVDHSDDCSCCTDEEAIINEDPGDEAGNDNKEKSKKDNNNNICEKKNNTLLSSEEEGWDYSTEEIASFLAGLEVSTALGKDDVWDDVFVPLDGTAHFSIATKMNHSCEPNVVILYNTNGWGKDHPLVASCVALKDIDADEELTISYITSDDPYEDRQSALENYGFVCCCPKCQKEKKENVEENGGNNNNVVVIETQSDDDNIDNVFGSDNDDDEAEDDLFGSDDDDDESNTKDDTSTYQKELDKMDGDSKLSQLVARIESCSNQTHVGTIPLVYLAPVSNQVIHDVKDVRSEITETKNEEDHDNDKLEIVVVDLASKCVTAIETRDFCSCRIVGDDLESALWRILKSNGSFPTPSYRRSYWSAAITAAIGYAHEGSFLTAMNYLDKALMLGQDRSTIDGFFSYVEMFATQMALGPCPPAVTCGTLPTFQEQDEAYDMLTKYGLSKPISSPVAEHTGTIKDFSNYLLKEEQTTKPIVVRNLASDWPATTKWRHIGNMVRRFGHRLVPIEVGSISMSSSTEEGGLKEELVTFREFVSKYISSSSEKHVWSLEDAVTTTASDNNNNNNNENDNGRLHRQVAYLAQHPLLDQIQELYDDVESNPCGISPTNIYSWMGTGGTRTPLHYDSYDNLFVQVVGAKYVRLYDNNQTSKLYVSSNKSYGLQGNMSEIDCELEDYDKYPLLKGCPYTEVLLRPGDCLFIPSRYWHYVRSLSTSISVNYWF